PARHRPARREGDRPRHAPLLGAVRARPAVRGPGRARLVGLAARRGRPESDPDLHLGRPAMTPVRVLVGFRPEVGLEREDGALLLAHPWGRYRLRGLRPCETEGLTALADGPVDPATLAELRDALRERLAPLCERT